MCLSVCPGDYLLLKKNLCGCFKSHLNVSLHIVVMMEVRKECIMSMSVCVCEGDKHKQELYIWVMCSMCAKVRGPASCSAALTGSVLPRNKVSLRVCVSLLQSCLDRFLSCFRCEKQEVIVHQSATCRLRCQSFHSTCSSGHC